MNVGPFQLIVLSHLHWKKPKSAAQIGREMCASGEGSGSTPQVYTALASLKRKGLVVKRVVPIRPVRGGKKSSAYILAAASRREMKRKVSAPSQSV